MHHVHDDKCGCVPPKYSRLVLNSGIDEKFVGKNTTMILGFTGTGMIGNIVASEIIKQLNMEQIGCIDTEDLPAIAIINNGILNHPLRLFYSSDKNLVVVQCEIPFNNSATYTDLARVILKLAFILGIKDICSVQGIMGLNDETEVFLAAEKKILKDIKTIGSIQILPKGIIYGPEAAILNETLNNEINGFVLLAPIKDQIPSPDGSAAIIEKLNEIYHLDVKTDELLKEAENIKKKMNEINEKTRELHSEIDPKVSRLPDPKYNMYL